MPTPSPATSLGARRFSRRAPHRSRPASPAPENSVASAPAQAPLGFVRRLSVRAKRASGRTRRDASTADRAAAPSRLGREHGAFAAPAPPTNTSLRNTPIVPGTRLRTESCATLSSVGGDSLDAAADVADVCDVPPPAVQALPATSEVTNSEKDVSVRSPTPGGGFQPNPLALLAKLPVAARGHVYISQHGGPLKNRLFRRSVLKRYAEARGRVVLLRQGDRSPVVEIFSPVGAAVSVAETATTKRGSVEHVVTVAKRGYSLIMRFRSETQAESWAGVLMAMGAARVPRLTDFDVLAPIGEGASGKVFLVRDRKSGMKLALKCMNKSASALATGEPDARHAMDERVTHETMNGKHYIVSLRHAFQTRSKLYLATEFCDGGDVYNFVDSCGGGVSEEHAKIITAQVILGIKKLHEANIVFRDLKPENALITGDGRIRLADFGLCKQLETPAALTTTVCGTFSYASAEILTGDGYGRACDLWAVGIFLYHIMIGRPPRVSGSVSEAKSAIFDSKEPIIWYSDVMSEAAMSLVTSLIEVDPARRLGCGPGGISDLFDHAFFKGVNWDALASGKVPTAIKDTLPPPEQGDLRNFNQEEWANIVMDHDQDDDAFTEGSLWPMRNLQANPLPTDFVVSYSYSAEGAASGGRMLNL